jgi:hypothetical protein
MTRRADTHEMPLFATDAQIGAVLFGKEHAARFAKIAPRLEAKGLPLPCELHDNRRYLPAVLQWYAARYGVDVTRLPGRGEVKPWRKTG